MSLFDSLRNTGSRWFSRTPDSVGATADVTSSEPSLSVHDPLLPSGEPTAGSVSQTSEPEIQAAATTAVPSPFTSGGSSPYETVITVPDRGDHAGGDGAAPEADRPESIGRTGISRIFTRYTTEVYGMPDAEAAYEHGHVDGTFEGKPEPFRRFIVQSSEERLVAAQAARVQAHLKEVNDSLQARDGLSADLAGKEVLLAEATREEAAAVADGEVVAAAVEADTEALKALGREGSLLSAIPYTVAGVLFMIAEVVVVYTVLVQVMRIGEGADGWLKAFEQIGFALGVAALSFAGKAVYERAVERPYHDEKQKGRFFVIGGTLVALILLTLGTFGILRAEQFAEQTRDRAVARTERQAERTGVASAAPDYAQNARSMYVESDGSPRWGVLSASVGAGVLFMLVGSMTLGMATHHWWVYRNQRRPLNLRLRATGSRKILVHDRPHSQWTLLERADDALARQVRAAADRTRLAAELASGRVRLATFDRAALLARRDALDERLNALAIDESAAHRAALTEAYDSGFALAEANRDDLMPPISPFDLKAGSPSTGSGPRRLGPKPLRPFQMVRRNIVNLSRS